MNNSYVQQNLNSIRHMLNNNIDTIKSIKNITKDNLITNKQMQSVILMSCAAQLYVEIKDYLTNEELREVKLLFDEVDEIIENIKL